MRTRKPMGQPVDTPSKTPLSSSTVSGSWRCVVRALWPGRRRFSSLCMNDRSMSMPAGMPSTTPPTPGPWLSPKVVSVNTLPNVLRIVSFFII